MSRAHIKYALIFSFAVLSVISVRRETAIASAYLDLNAQSAVLLEQTTGKTLYAKDENRRMYPASTTKILTAIVALEYLDPDELVVVGGGELRGVPVGSSIADHRTGESLTVHNLLRALLIPSGNDTANIIAMAVAKKANNTENMNFADAERFFCELMNEKARELGAVNSNFVNAHGYHDNNHYSTAADIAKLSMAALDNGLIMEIAGERTFEGSGAGDNPPDGVTSRDYTWRTHNELLLDGQFSYMYATGLKTGLHDEGGYCVSATAERDGKKLVAVVLNSPTDEGRWQDSIKLLDFGFSYFNFETVQNEGDVLETMPLTGFKLGESDALDIIADNEYTGLYSKDELNRIRRTLEYSEEYVDQSNTESVFVRLKAPIEEGAVIGAVTYTLDGQVVFEGKALAARTVEKRTPGSDAAYYAEKIKQNAFTLDAVPYWAAGAAAVIFIILIITAVSKIRSRREPRYYTRRRRY